MARYNELVVLCERWVLQLSPALGLLSTPGGRAMEHFLHPPTVSTIVGFWAFCVLEGAMRSHLSVFSPPPVPRKTRLL